MATVELVNVNVATDKTPLEMVFELKPTTRHLYTLELITEQFAFFPADVAAAPSVTETPDMSFGLYVNSHCTPATLVNTCDVLIVRLRDTLLPFTPEPFDRVIVASFEARAT